MNSPKHTQENLTLPIPDGAKVEKYEFEPIKGYPMLNWRGKRPFTSTQYYPAQLKEVHGEEVDGWRNKIYWGDNLQVMSHLLKEFRGKVDLIYIDPPFDSKADYKKSIELQGQSAENGSTPFEEKQYSDLWNNDEYLQFMFERMILCRELLSESGAIYVHCDWHRNHYLRCILDEVFGQNNFQNEIVVHYTAVGLKGLSQKFHQNTETIYYYVKRKGEHTWNPVYVPISNPDNYRKASNHVWNPELGKAERKRDLNGDIEYFLVTEEKADNLLEIDVNNERILCVESDLPGGTFIEVAALRGNKKTGYPTQKPEEILERIIKASTNQGALVFDCFMGSGTTQATAMKLGRRFIGADINLGSIQTVTKRLTHITNDLSQKLLQPESKIFSGFEIYNVNHYDIFRNPSHAKDLLIEALEIQKLEFSTVFDGEKDGRMVKIMPVNRIATRADLNEMIAGFDYKAWERKQNESPNRPVEKITLVCMGHEPDLAAQLELATKPFKIEVEVVDILRDKANLEFKRDSQAKVTIKNGELIIDKFYPMNLLQKLSMQKESVEDWKELVESVLIDWNYDGAILQPEIVDIPSKNVMVKGAYKVPEEAGTIRVKITDLLSESWEGSFANGN